MPGQGMWLCMWLCILPLPYPTRLAFALKLWQSTGMGNKDARNREKKKPKKKPEKISQAPPPIVRTPAPKP
jgi:hypothetical protein